MAVQGASTTVQQRPGRPNERSQPRDDDAALVNRFRGGERAAFDQLVRRYQRPIYFLMLRHVGDPDEAAELTQRSFIKALSGVGELRGASQFRTWLFKIAVHLALNHLRDYRKFTRDDELDQLPSPASAPVDELVAAERARALRAAVARLPAKQKLTLELRVYEDLPFREVAEILGTTENAAKVNFHYAVQRLKEWLGHE